MKNQMLVLACAVSLGIGGMFISSAFKDGDDARVSGAVGTYQVVVGGSRSVAAP